MNTSFFRTVISLANIMVVILHFAMPKAFTWLPLAPARLWRPDPIRWPKTSYFHWKIPCRKPVLSLPPTPDMCLSSKVGRHCFHLLKDCLVWDILILFYYVCCNDFRPSWSHHCGWKHLTRRVHIKNLFESFSFTATFICTCLPRFVGR